MSQAGKRSHRGDQYQLRIALEWLIRLWTDPDVEGVQVESLGVVGDSTIPTVDDVVVLRRGGQRIYIQAKKNQTEFKSWSLSDTTLQAELINARDQLEQDEEAEVWFYSRSNFGELQKLREDGTDYPDFSLFQAHAPSTLRDPLEKLAEIIDRPASECFQLLPRIRYKVTGDFDDVDHQHLTTLRSLFARPEEVREQLMALLERHQANLPSVATNTKTVFQKEDIEAVLADRGHFVSPSRRLDDLLATFGRTSQIGRKWKRDIDEHRVEREALEDVVSALEGGTKSILITSQPGAGKTCLLLDLADTVESKDDWTLLFIKGDQYSGAVSESDLVGMGFMEDPVGQCSRLAAHRRVLVVVDALDVLSLQRSGGTLELFLGMLDRLERIEGASIIAACRDFDLKYDPRLRGRDWELKIPLGLLDYENDVAPILRSWGQEPTELTASFQELLCVPQHLRLYGRLLKEGVVEISATQYGLHDRFLTEIIANDPSLGKEALEILATTAERMQQERTMTLPWSAIPADPELLKRLLSAEILIETRIGILSFSHQELLDVVAVRAAIERGETLHAFIQARPPFPFLRPTVRTFFFALRVADERRFRREVRAVLGDESVAYHLRRLVVESLAEVEISIDDWPLVRWLLINHSDLFERMLAQASGDAWLSLITDQVLPSVRTHQAAEWWTVRILIELRRWAICNPSVVLKVCQTAYDEQWLDSERVTWILVQFLSDLSKGLASNDVDVEELRSGGFQLALERALSNATPDDYYPLASVIREWVTASDEGDELVWKFIEIGEKDAPIKNSNLQLQWHEISDWGKAPDGFLIKRLARSNELIDRVLESTLEYATNTVGTGRQRILEGSSWQGRHTRGILLGVDTKKALIVCLEEAVKIRAAMKDPWWSSHEEVFRSHPDIGMKYIALQAYRAQPNFSAKAIARVLVDKTLLQKYNLASEVRELANIAYVYLKDDQREAHQNTLLETFDTDEPDDCRRSLNAQPIYNHLLWIPPMYRTKDSSEFIARWENDFGYYLYSSASFLTVRTFLRTRHGGYYNESKSARQTRPPAPLRARTCPGSRQRLRSLPSA